MDKKKWKLIAVAFAFALCYAGCDNARYEALVGDGSETVYISDATTAINRNISLTSDPIITERVSIRLNQATGHDVKVKMGYSDATLDKTNKILGTIYNIYPKEYLYFPEEITIPAGEVYSNPFTVSIDNSFDTAGEEYAMPFQIISCEGAQIAKGSSEICLTIVKEIGNVYVPIFGQGKSCGTKFEPIDQKWDEKWPQATIEWWVCSDNYPINNVHMFTAGSNDDPNDEVYCRFGDIDYSNYYNYLQIKVYGAQQKFDSGDPREQGKGLENGKWYHFAMVFDKGEYRLYKNGVLVDTHNGGNEFLDTDQFILCSGSSRATTTKVCEVRMWKSARTPEQIKNYMFIQPRYKDPNLVFYAPMHEGPENNGMFHDVTENGHNGPMGNQGGGQSAIEWVQVNFSSSNTDLL